MMRKAVVSTIVLFLFPALLLLAADPKDADEKDRLQQKNAGSANTQRPAGRDAKRGDEKQKSPSSKAARSKRMPGVTRGREAAVMAFVREHHPELESLLVYLKKSGTDEYKEAFLELFQQSERLAQVQETDEARYELELAKWKVESRIKLLVARMQMDKSPELVDQLRSELAQQVHLRIELMKSDRRRMVERIEKTDQRIERLTNNSEQEIERQMRILTSAAARATSKVSTKPAPPAKKNPAAPQ